MDELTLDFTWIKNYYIASKNEISPSSSSAKDVQVILVTLTDLPPNFWTQPLSINNNKLRQYIPCRGDDSRTSAADKYQTLPTQTICSVQRAMKIMTVVVSILITIPREPRWPAQDTGAQKRSMLCYNIIPRNNVSCRNLLRFQWNWSLRSGCQGRKVKVDVIRTKYNPRCILWDRKLWVVEFQSSFRQMWRLFIIIIMIIYLSWSWATCWPVPGSRVQKSLQKSAMILSASWGIAFQYPG